ncbi:hypothetical protein DRN93_01435 [archaeon]|nr:MAG: hypothetical protein DRN93_01435 [archaeon]
MIPVVEITRKEATKEGTLGVVVVNKELFCVSLEPYYDKQIPPGMYYADLYFSPRFKRNVYLLSDVVGRAYIEIHPGNLVEHTEGCILLGQYPGKLRGNRAVLNSGATFTRFMEKLEPAERIIVIIKEDY